VFGVALSESWGPSGHSLLLVASAKRLEQPLCRQKAVSVVPKPSSDCSGCAVLQTRGVFLRDGQLSA
jgi:hypothetical protein